MADSVAMNWSALTVAIAETNTPARLQGVVTVPVTGSTFDDAWRATFEDLAAASGLARGSVFVTIAGIGIHATDTRSPTSYKTEVTKLIAAANVLAQDRRDAAAAQQAAKAAQAAVVASASAAEASRLMTLWRAA